MAEEIIYLDHNATTPVDEEVFRAMVPYLKEFYGNPSSSHPYGIAAKSAVETARENVAKAINAEPDEIIFTGGATESNNLAILGTAYRSGNTNGHIITSSIEHPAVLEVCRWLEKQGFSVSYLPVDKKGRVSPDDVSKAIRPDTFLISIMLANNEVGIIEPLQEISLISKSRGIILHTDAAQALGKINVDVRLLGVDLLSIAGHKMYAPKGIGALYRRRGLPLTRILHGADHEMNLRPGTENVPYIVGLGAAATLSRKNLNIYSDNMHKTRDRLFEELKRQFPWIKSNTDFKNALPNTANICFPGVDANTLLAEIGDRIAASAGAACHTDSVEPSHVLKAMGLSIDEALSSIRFSTGRKNTKEEIDKAVELLVNSINKLKKPSSSVFITAEETEKIRLTRFTHGMGCACKLRPENLEKLLAKLPPATDKNLIIDASTSDDAAVYKIDDKHALIQTVDFFTPIVDDPYHFGRIAAVNSLSDIYAMGGKPLFALNLVGFPEGRLPLSVLSQILEGALSVARDAGINVAGGHTIDNPEPIFGWSVTGIAKLTEILRNNTPEVGDILILTKPIGTGIYSTALKKGLINQGKMEYAIALMEQLNSIPSQLAVQCGVHAMTDITGFGLLGHLKEMLGKHHGARLNFSDILFLEDLPVLIRQGAIPGGTEANLASAEKFTQWENEFSGPEKLMLCDAQTSGGLLIAMPPHQLKKFLELIDNYKDYKATAIGEVTDTPGIKVCRNTNTNSLS